MLMRRATAPAYNVQSGVEAEHAIIVSHDVVLFQFLRRGSGPRLIAATNGSCLEGMPTLSLAKAVARARNWYGRIVTGEINSIDQLAQSAGLTRRYVRKLLLFASLSPRLTEGILMGKHRADLTVRTIVQGVPLSWREQERRFG